MPLGVRSIILILMVSLAVAAPIATGAERSACANLDWSAWQALPVHDSGRVMPLDTFARSLVDLICDSTNPRLGPAEPASVDESRDQADTVDILFPDGKSRRFTAAELVFSWLVEPERWEDVPLLSARHESLRADLLQVRLVDRRGKRLAYVSPRQLEQSRKARARLSELARIEHESQGDGRPLTLSEADRQLKQLNDAHHAYRVLTFEGLDHNGRCLRVLPSLSPFAVQPTDRTGDVMQPWITLQMLLFGSEAVLQGYPREKVAEVRESFAEAKSAYLDRKAPNRPERFANAMQRFSGALRSLGKAIEPTRLRLLDDDHDKDRLSATAYPIAGTLDRELLYNRLDPFLWSWILTAASIACLALGFGFLREATFFAGATVLAAGQGFAVAGFCLRASITGIVPVTNMYETVLFVAVTVASFGLWFALLPLIWPVFDAAWRMTAAPPLLLTAAATALSGEEARWFRRALSVLRGILVLCLFYVLAIHHLNPRGDGPIVSLLPVVSSGTIGGLLAAIAIWLVGLVILASSLWLFPRVLLTIVLSVALIPKAIKILCAEGLAKPIHLAVSRRPFLLAGATVALVAYLVAYYAPKSVFHRELGFGMAAVLRSNFWLALHVLIITASYGAGALAWGLANISLGYYVLGRYRQPSRPSAKTVKAGHRPARNYHAPESAFRHRPPAICAKLANYIYKSIQVAVLLLAAGTITGAIWADYAWGRYWGWDPKEVWALISLLLFLAVLHGRWAGWTGNFGIAVGAVLGATSILMAWYGVNFFLGGLHSYGSGAGDVFYVLMCVLANWLLVGLAAIRYWTEKLTVVEPRNMMEAGLDEG